MVVGQWWRSLLHHYINLSNLDISVGRAKKAPYSPPTEIFLSLSISGGDYESIHISPRNDIFIFLMYFFFLKKISFLNLLLDLRYLH
jgi:hypothetical protein